MTLRARLEKIVRADPDLMRLLDCLRTLALPEGWIVSGCIYQTVWNTLTGRPRGTGLQDYDVIYFDADDPSWEAEDAVIRRAAEAATGFPAPIQVRNQARVHLWYEARFCAPYPPLGFAADSLTRYPATVQSVAARLDGEALNILAPFGLDDIFDMVLRPNPLGFARDAFDAKAARARAVWPEAVVAQENGR